MANKREKREQRFRDARQRAETHDSGGRSSLRLPDGVSLFQVKSRDVKRIEVIPYEVARDNVNPNCPEAGYLYHERTFFVHRDVGGSGETYVCPSRTFKKPCPVCEYRGKLTKDPEADEQVIKDMAPKERQLFNVYDHAEPDKGVQIWDISYHLFGKSLDTRIKAPDAEEDDDYAQFAHPESGMTVRITPEENKMGSNTFFDCSGIEFRPRKRPLSEEILSGAHDLDSLIKEVSYADLKKVLFQTPAEDEEDNKPTPNGKKPAKGKPVADDEDDDEDEDDEPVKPAKGKGKGKMPTAADFGIKVGDLVTFKGEECEVVKISPDGTSLTLESEDGDTFRAVGPEEVKPAKPTKGKPVADDDEDDDEDEPVKPAKGKPTPAKGKKVPDPDEEEDDWDEEEDDEEEPAKPIKGKKAPPPAKGKPAIADDDWDEDEDDEEEPAKPAKGKATTKPADDDDWDEDDEDEDEDDEPVKPAKPAKGKAVKGKGK